MLRMKERLGLKADTESIMRASYADTARQSAQVRDRLADTVRISRTAVTMPTASVIGSRSKIANLTRELQTYLYTGSLEA